MRFLRYLPVLAVGLALTFLVACGGGDKPAVAPGSGHTTTGQQSGAAVEATVSKALAEATKIAGASNIKRVDPCSLLTADEVGAAVDMEARLDADSSGMGECTWSVGDPEMSLTVTLMVGSESEYDIFRGDSATPVSGLGDEAYWGFLSVLSVRDGKQVVQVQIATLQDDALAQAAAQELAAKVLERL